MKKSILLIISALFIFQSGCKKNETYFIDDETPDLKGVMNLT